MLLYTSFKIVVQVVFQNKSEIALVPGEFAWRFLMKTVTKLYLRSGLGRFGPQSFRKKQVIRYYYVSMMFQSLTDELEEKKTYGKGLMNVMVRTFLHLENEQYMNITNRNGYHHRA